MNRVIPWSGHEEMWLTRIVTLDWILAWVFFVGAGGAFLWRQLLLGIALDSVAILWAALLLRDRNKLRTMLQNKPRSTAGLTEWVKLRPWQTEICCACGTIVHIDGAPWFPNPVDAGGGRYSIVCPCGIGYFKLREEKVVTRVS